jgi:hypothetical protein
VARIRTIKPEFFTDEDLGRLPPLTRLLFIGMWTEADKAGRMKDKAGTLKARLMPFDNMNVEKALQELAAGKFIVRYQVDGEQYIQIRTWNEHQRPHHTERESNYPDSVNGELTVKEPLLNGEKNCSRKREPSLPFLSLPFPSSLEGSVEFQEEWESWVKHRVQIKKPLTAEQVKKQLQEFGEWGVERAVAAIRHTVKKGWQGIREPEAFGQCASNGQAISSHEAAMRKLEEMGKIGKDDE